MKSKSPEIFLSKKDLQTFFKVSNSEIKYLIKNYGLKPIYKKGMQSFSLTNILDATFHLTKYAKNNSKK